MSELERLMYVVDGVKATIKELCNRIANERYIRSDYNVLKETFDHLEEAEKELNSFVAQKKAENEKGGGEG